MSRSRMYAIEPYNPDRDVNFIFARSLRRARNRVGHRNVNLVRPSQMTIPQHLLRAVFT